SLFTHEGVFIRGRRDKSFFDRSSAHPAEKINDRAGLVVRTARSRSTEWLLAHNGAGGFVIYIEVAGGIAQRLLRVGNSCTIRGKHASGQSVRRSLIHELECRMPFLFRIDVERDDRTEQLFTHRPVIWFFGLDQRRTNKISDRIVDLTARYDLRIGRTARFFEVTCEFLE